MSGCLFFEEEYCVSPDHSFRLCHFLQLLCERTVEAPLICDIVHQQYAHCASAIGRSDRPKSLLPRCVPYLKFYPFAIKLDRSDLEVYPYGCDK